MYPAEIRARRFRRQVPTRNIKAVEIPKLDRYHRERLWEKVDQRGDDECWPWTAAKAGVGYGRFKYRKKLYSPHRLIYALVHGPIVNAPEHHGSVVMHTCDNRICCNPAHLKLGTQVDNVADMFAKGRAHQCKLACDAPSASLPFLNEAGR